MVMAFEDLPPVHHLLPGECLCLSQREGELQ